MKTVMGVNREWRNYVKNLINDIQNQISRKQQLKDQYNPDDKQYMVISAQINMLEHVVALIKASIKPGDLEEIKKKAKKLAKSRM